MIYLEQQISTYFEKTNSQLIIKYCSFYFIIFYLKVNLDLVLDVAYFNL